MIVICSRCQARFRVADEKVGPRGAKVRCSHCQTLFVVRREAASEKAPPPAPAAAQRKPFDIELTPGLPRPGPAADPFAGDPFAGASQPATMPPQALASAPGTPAEPPPPDPFAAAGLAAFGEPVPAKVSADDPFAQIAAGVLSSGSYEVAAPAPAVPERVDPFALGGEGDPFDPPAAPAGSASQASMAVTDLSQLLGGAASPSLLAAEPSTRPPAGAQALAKELDLAAELAMGSDLALEERSAPVPPQAFADPADVSFAGGLEPEAFAGAAFEESPQAMAPVGEPSLSLASEPTPAPEEPDPKAAAPSAEPEELPPPRPAPLPPAGAEAEIPRVAAPPTTAERIRSAAVGALALIALLVIALAFRVVWRGDVPLGPAAFRPSALLRALGRIPAPVGPFEVVGVRSGLYEQQGGGTVLFVRGEVVSHAAAPVESVRVAAELVRDGQVLARGEALAGALPTPEEVHRATDRTALEAMASKARSRTPGSILPGERAGFLVVLGDAPADVSGASVRVRAEAGGGEK